MNEINTVTIGIIAYNEHKYLPDLLSDLQKQTYSKSLTEVILVDGESTDNTFQIMKKFQIKYKSEYKDIKILTNPKRVQPAGWNVVINHFTTDVLIRVDAHARLPEDFIEKNMTCLNSGEYVCGGPRENIMDEDTAWKRILLAAEQSMFGSGIASYRQKTEQKKYVKSLFHGAYRREVLNKVGLFNEDLVRTEDNEYHYRIRKAGYKICYDPQIKSYYQTRNNLLGMLKQKFQNGFWIGKTIFLCPKCLSVFHLIPLTFVIAIIFTSILVLLGTSWPATVLWLMYGMSNLMMTIMASNTIYFFLLPAIFLLLHTCYGVGSMKGFIEIILQKLGGGYDEELSSLFNFVTPCPSCGTGTAA